MSGYQKNKVDLLCVILTYNRDISLHKVILNLRRQSVLCDIVIWNNGSELKFRDDSIKVFKGNNNLGLLQRFLLPLVYPHKYVMFIDDDIMVGRRFAEHAISVINNIPEALIVTMGSIMDNPVTVYTVDNRLFIAGRHMHNKNNIHVDIGSVGCSVILRKHIHAIFRSGIIPHRLCDEHLFSMSHRIYNNGVIIIPRHDEKDIMGIRTFSEEHAKGLNSEPDFFHAKTNALINISNELGWKPYAKSYPEWQEGGEAHNLLPKEN